MKELVIRRKNQKIRVSVREIIFIDSEFQVEIKNIKIVVLRGL
jgi:hypothetical protein